MCSYISDTQFFAPRTPPPPLRTAVSRVETRTLLDSKFNLLKRLNFFERAATLVAVIFLDGVSEASGNVETNRLDDPLTTYVSLRVV